MYGWKIRIHIYASDSEILTHIALQDKAGRKSTGKNYPIKSPQSCMHLELVLKAPQKESTAVNISSSLILSRSIQSISPSEDPLIHLDWEENEQTLCSESCQNKTDLETRVEEKYWDLSHSERKERIRKTKTTEDLREKSGSWYFKPEEKPNPEHVLVAIERTSYFQPQLQMWWDWSEYVCLIIFNSYIKDT